MAKRRVFGWLADESGCGYYRIMQPLTHLPDDRYDVAYSTRLPPDWRDYDVIIGQRVCMPGVSDRWREICRDPSILAVYEVDDDLLRIHRSNTTAYQFFGRPDIRANIEANARHAQRITVTTPGLANLMGQFSTDVRIVPNYIDAALIDRYADRVPPADQPDNDGTVMLGWGGSPTHKMDFAVVSGVLKKFLRAHPQVTMTFVGAEYASGLPADRVTFTGFLPLEEYWAALARFDVAIAPLSDHVFNSSKSHVKALEYSALGIPHICSQEAPYRDFVQHGTTGLLAKGNTAWSEALAHLTLDPDTRRDMGRSARDHARQWTIQGHISEWEKALD
jgi:glycosyltransferase involved in cell wall biosynthesis